MRVSIGFFVAAVMAAVWIAAGEAAGGTVRYVNASATGAGNGTSWTDAFTQIQPALAASTAGDEVWVATGIYQEHILMKPDVGLYGGFAGGETLRDQRDWTTNHSVITGGGGPFPAPPTQGATIVIKDLAGPNTVVDGFTITGGHGYHGGGIQITGAGPTISNNLITNNRTDGAGAGISIWGYKTTSPVAYPTITKNIIVENYSVNDEGDGGGIAVINSAPSITENIIARNEATRNGGGIACWRTHMPFIAYNYILANSSSVPIDANEDPAASVGGGGIFASATDLDGRPISDAFSAPWIVSNVIAANGGAEGAGVCLVDSIRTDLPVAKVYNNTIASNSACGLFWTNASPIMKNNIVAYNAKGVEKGVIGTTGGTFEYNCVYGNVLNDAAADYVGIADQTGMNGNIRVDPRFADYTVGEYHLQPGSLCIDAGTNAIIEAGWKDVEGQDRLQGGAVDMGADESDGTLWNIARQIIHVRPEGSDSADGLSWSTAKKTVTAGIATAASTYGEVWVAAGTYNERITLPAYVYLYGGFFGTETVRTQRNPSVNVTTLEGGGIIRVVQCFNSGYRISIIDGFTIRGGGVFDGGTWDGGQYGVEGMGAGIYVRVCSPTINGNIIKRNSLGKPGTGSYARGAGIGCYMSHALITGNTVTENEILNPNGFGGGIYCALGMPDIKGNTISDNRTRSGAGIGCMNCVPRIVGNTIEYNRMYELMPKYMGAPEGAVDLSLCSDFLIDRNIIRNNRAATGAGITALSNFAGKITNNLIASNITYDPSSYTGGIGGGIYCLVSQYNTGPIEIINNTITGNTATAWGMEFGGGIAFALYDNRLIIANNVITFNSSGMYRYPVFPLLMPDLRTNCLYNGSYNYVNMTSGGPTDFIADPQFVSRTTGNYHLLGSSPCIDTGGNASVPAVSYRDLDNRCRFVDGDGNGSSTVDVGAYEFIAASIGDLDGDCDVDFCDYGVLAAAWMTSSGGAGWNAECDINSPADGTVDMKDLLVLVQHWLQGKI